MPVTIARTKDIDLGWKSIKAALRRASNRMAAVGIFAKSKHPETGVAVALYAAVMEYGNPGRNIPERPFMRRTVERNLDGIFHMMDSELRLLYDSKGASLPTLLQTTAEWLEEKMVGEVFIAKEWAAPLAPSTVARKGHDLPLLDTFALVNSIAHRVTTRGQMRRLAGGAGALEATAGR